MQQVIMSVRRLISLRRALLALLLAMTLGMIAGCGPATAPGAGQSGSAASVRIADPVAVYLTTANLDKTLERQADLHFAQGTGSDGTRILVDATQHYQTLSAGFGVALTDTSAWLLQVVLPPVLRDRAMAQLFSPDTGIGLSYLRVGMGGTDYNVSRQPYTYDDLPAGETDPELKHFSLDHDRAYIIPALQQALGLNPDMVFTTSPWSPPAWMKSDGQLVPTTPLSMLKSDAFAPWAQYFVKFVQGYAEAGIHFDHISIQNEPLNPLILPGIPGMLLPPHDAISFVNNHLAPAFKANDINSKIMVWDFSWELDATYIPLVMAGAGSQIGALAYHCYLSDPTSMSFYQALYGLPQYETECSSKLSNIEPAQMMIRALNNWAEGVQLWNAALDTTGGPKFGAGCVGQPGTAFSGQDCIAPVTVDMEKRTYALSSDYWALAHFSKFIRKGARRIASNGLAICYGGPQAQPCALEGTAFENVDGSRVLVLNTSNGKEASFTLTDNDKHVTYTLPAGATATLIWSPKP